MIGRGVRRLVALGESDPRPAPGPARRRGARASVDGKAPASRKPRGPYLICLTYLISPRDRHAQQDCRGLVTPLRAAHWYQGAPPSAAAARTRLLTAGRSTASPRK